ncbi:MAG TPA: HAMP domain-containing sensor histidine kinase [Polyangiaceae bacterium]
MGLLGRVEPGTGHERFGPADRVRFLARAGRILDAARPERSIVRLTAELFVPKFALACRVEVEEEEASAFVDEAGEVHLQARRTGEPDAAETDVSDTFDELQSRLTSSLLSAPIPAAVPGTLTVIVQRALDREDVVAVRDVARRVGAALERRRLVEEARTARRHHDELILRTSHELRTPLASLSLHLSGLLRAARTGKLGNLAEPTIEKLARADAQLERVLGHIAQLVRKPPVDPRAIEISRTETDLAAVVRDVAERCSAKAAGRGFALRLSADRPVMGRWDRELVQRALSNLVTYLLDSAPAGELEIGTHRSRGGARALVRVQGFGIPAADQAELLRGGPDASTPDRLGLFIARRIVEAHGGRIRVRSSRGTGTELVLFLPGTDA